MTTTDLELFVEYGFVDLTGDNELADLHAARHGQRNGICGAQVAGHLSMITGTHTGSVAFRVEMHDAAPVVDDLWDEVVEFSVEIPTGSMQLATFDDWHDLPAMVPGWHRARYCAVAMDEGRDADPPVGLACSAGVAASGDQSDAQHRDPAHPYRHEQIFAHRPMRYPKNALECRVSVHTRLPSAASARPQSFRDV